MTAWRNTFTRIFLLYAAIILLASLAIELYLTSAVRGSHIASREQGLAVQAALVSEELRSADPSRLNELCRHLKGVTGSRVTIIAQDGKVLGDSDRKPSLMDNHADRPEIRGAMERGIGTAIRMSDTLHYDFLYVARKSALPGKTEGYVRLSVPLKDVDAAVNRLRFHLSLAILLILAATGIFSLWQIGHLRGLTRQVRDFAQALARGDVGKRLHLDAPGEFDEIARSLSDMSNDLQKVLAESDEEKRRLNVILRSIPDALLIIDDRGVVQISSAAGRAYFGDAATGRPLIEVIRDSGFLALVDTARDSRSPATAELFFEHPVERHCIVRVSPLFYREAELAGLVVVFNDVTRLKRLEQVRKDFVANLSHELKTPITSIQGFAETLLDGGLDDRDHALKFLETIRQNSERINKLVDDLMTISQIETDVIRIAKAPVNTAEVVADALEMLEDRTREKGLSVTVSIEPALADVEADRDRLFQIVMNLIENAFKFTDKGSITIGIREAEGRRELFVEDTGIGVPEKHLPRLGERFYRVDPARSRKLGGTGLGLAIVKHLVKAHGWEMKIESTAGKGTTVRILLT